MTTERPSSLPGIDLRHEAQLKLWESWAPFFADCRHLTETDPSRRYQLPSTSYDIGDAFIYTCMLRQLKPARLIEIGSGCSSAVALDAIDRYALSPPPRCSFIEPYPALLKSLLKPGDMDRIEILAKPVQDVAPAYFDDLHKNDVLFIDSTHVFKTGSDVLFELFEILPRLKSGVVVHFHDIFYPFEYPANWVLYRNFSWNEVYALRAFLTDNPNWEILFFNDYFVRSQSARIAQELPAILQNPGGGLWLRRR